MTTYCCVCGARKVVTLLTRADGTPETREEWIHEDADQEPGASHGYCPECFRVAIAEAKARRLARAKGLA
jgi:hypothetical protein